MYEETLVEARRDFEAAMKWSEFSQKYFGQGSKFIPKEKEERREYVKSDVFRQIQDMKFGLEEKQSPAELEETQPLPSGKLNVRIPRSLHAKLLAEARLEDTSLNQLMLAKLAVPIYNRAADR